MTRKKRVITFGELMLRLAAPRTERLLQSPQFEATFGGSEANVAIDEDSLTIGAAMPYDVAHRLEQRARNRPARSTRKRYSVNAAHLGLKL